MFIHFGLYSVYGGVYDGKPVERGYSEQIQSFAGIFSDWYGNTARDFNPEKWNPDEIVQLAKDAGMKSIVFTSKHHDGFCMYHSRYTDFNIVDATPYGKDLMKGLAEACSRGGIGFSVYFSLIDWHFPQAYPISSHNADLITPEHYQYNLKQVEEIMTNYGHISEIWFDMGSLTLEQSKGLYELVNRLQPNCMISGRLGNDYVDFAVMADNEYPDYKLGVPWQTAASIFHETWSYRSWQERGEVQPKVDEKIASLIKVISRGGNYLLNIGPRGDGSVVEFERDVLLGIGKWVKASAEAIYETRANPFEHSFVWGDVTTKGNNLYLFVRKEYAGKDIDLLGFMGNISRVSQLDTNEKCGLSLPKVWGKPYYIRIPITESIYPYTVVNVEFKDGLTVLPKIVKSDILKPQNATPIFGHSSLNYYAGYKTLIGYDWTFRSRKQTLTPEIAFTDNEKGREIECEIDGKKQTILLQPTASKIVKLPKNAVKWGDLYRKRGRGVFGNVEEEGTAHVRIADDAKWQKVTDFRYGETIEENILPRASVVFLQEIQSDEAQEIAVEITSGNAVYILLNGEYITAHFSPQRLKKQKETLLLPLKKGDNQLIIKYYNGFEKSFSYGIMPLNEWTVYTQRLSPVTLDKKEHHSFSIRLANPDSKVSPLRMSNIRIIGR